MKCPFCAAPDSRVVDSRTTDDGNSIRRRRECTVCGKRFTTYETVEKVPLMVIKNDGSRANSSFFQKAGHYSPPFDILFPNDTFIYLYNNVFHSKIKILPVPKHY